MKWLFVATSTEVALAKYIAGRVDRVGRANGREIWGSKTPEEWMALRVRGVTAELVIARAINVFPNLEDGTDAARMDGWDLIYGDSRIDVKCPDVGLNLVVPVRTPMLHGDAYVMAYETEPTVFEIVGWCWWNEVLRKDKIWSLGDGKNDKFFRLEAKELHPMDEFHYVRLGPRNTDANLG